MRVILERLSLYVSFDTLLCINHIFILKLFKKKNSEYIFPFGLVSKIDAHIFTVHLKLQVVSSNDKTIFCSKYAMCQSYLNK